MSSSLHEMSPDELAESLHRLRAESQQPSLDPAREEQARVIHDLQVHQVELEMQNRELRDAHARLEAARDRYADLYELAPLAYVTLDISGRVLDANLTATTFFGVDRASIIGKLLASLGGLGDRSAERTKLRAHLRRCVADRVRCSAELDFVVKDGTAVCVHIDSAPVFDDDGGVRSCRCSLTDVTQLRASELRTRLLANASEVLASSFDVDRTLARVAALIVPAFADVCLVDLADEHGCLVRVHEEVVDRPPLEGRRAKPLRPARAPSPQERVVRTREPVLCPDWNRATAAHTAPGADIEVQLLRAGSVMFIPIPTANAGVSGVLTLAKLRNRAGSRRLSATELTLAQDLASRVGMALENARLFADVQRALAARDEVLSIVSHDLKNPLSTISLGVEQLLMSAADGDRRHSRKHLEAMRRGAKQIDRMIRDLLDLASIESGRLSIEAADVDVDALVADALEMLVPLARAKRIALHAETLAGRGDHALVWCDRERVLQVLSNVVGNAVKFTPQGGRILVSLARQGELLEVAVRDTGPGIAPESLMRVFERHWQAKETAKLGRGLGLYIAKGIVEAQGGTLRVESTLGEGSTFTFTLPLSPSEDSAGPQRKSATAAPPLGGDADKQFVLVVDDDADAREMLCEMLEAHDCRVHHAGNGRDALAWLRGSAVQPDVILLDLHMPVMDGWECLRQLKGDPLLARVPVVLVSSYTDVKGAAEQLGAEAFVRKPVAVERLLEMMRALRAARTHGAS